MDSNGNLRVEDGRTGKDTPEAPGTPDGQETASVEALRAQVAALTVERDIAMNHWRTVKQTIREISERLMEVSRE